MAWVLVQSTGACSSAVRGPIASPPTTSRYVLEQVTRDRWVQPGQLPEFTPFSDVSSALYLTVPTAYSRAGERTIYVAMRNPLMGDSALLSVRRDGNVVRQSAWLRPIPSFGLPEDSVHMARFRLLVGGRLLLPLARTWDLIPRVRPRRFAPGERWTDTIALATELDGSRQALNGRRTSVLIGDTLVAGRRLWVVRDSADVRYTERELQQERTLNALVAVDRSATGTVRSRYFYDRELGLFWGRADTTSLAGEAVLRYPDGRSFRTPARYQRTRLWTLYDPDVYATRQAEQRAEAQRKRSGPVRVPGDETQRRLSSGDLMLRDSLTTAWDRERDPNHREELYRLLQLWAPGGPAFRDQLLARRIAAGDSAFAVEQLAHRAFPAQPPIQRAEAEQMIRVMRDPGIPFALGVSRDALYENLVQTFVTSPRALMADSSRWPCVPEACRLLEEQWRLATEPRLRDVGLAALVTRDPAQWADSGIARAAAGSSVIASAAQLAQGVGATWPAAAKLPLPGPNADWRAWLAWMNGPAPGYRPPSNPAFERAPNGVRFEGSHINAIRFYEVRSGRDVVGELRRDLAAATDDSARLVFGAMLNGLGDRPSVDQIAAQFRSGSGPQIELAQRALGGLFRQRAPVADSATQVAILNRLITAEVEKVTPWPQLEPPRGSVPVLPVPQVRQPRTESPTPALYMLADSVPPALQAKWRDRVRFIGSDEWRAQSQRDPASLVTLSRPERVGPFVKVRVSTAGRLARQPNETPHLFYGDTVYYLLAGGDSWVVVMMWVSIT